MRLNAIHHVAIIVSDIHDAKEFYVDKLGFESPDRRPAVCVIWHFVWKMWRVQLPNWRNAG